MTPTTKLFPHLTLADLPYEARFRRIALQAEPVSTTTGSPLTQTYHKATGLYCELCLCQLPLYSGSKPVLCEECLLHFATTPTPLAVRERSVVRRPAGRRMGRVERP